MSRIHVHIERVVLPGSAGGDQAALVGGLKAELAQALADPAIPSQWARSRQMRVLRLGSIPLKPGPAGGRQFGQEVARGIAKGLTR